MIYTNNCPVHRFSTDGRPGDNGADGGSSSRLGGDGHRGKDGQNGAHASALNMSLKVAGDNIQVFANQRTVLLPLRDRNIAIALQACGGDGGKGGKGGKGAVGYDGDDGQDATMWSWGTDGEDGGPGGDGGDGGRGGKGGNGANITLKVDTGDADLLMIPNTPDTKAGKGGVGGCGGRGGRGGYGGCGGSSKIWFTGDSHNRQMHFHPGGSDGYNGPDGYDGHKGQNGADGQPGSFRIEMDGRQFKDRYNLSVHSCTLEDDNGDGIFEPGEGVSVAITLENNGGMKLPTAQDTRVSIKNNECLIFDSASTIFPPRGLDAGKRYTPPEKLRFRLGKRNDPVVGEPLKINTKVDFRATVSRVERHFAQVEGQTKSFRVQYPAQLQKVRQVTSISLNEEALLSVRVDNVSNAALGTGSAGKRVTTLNYRVLPGEMATASDVCFFSKEGEKTPGESGLIKPVTYLTPGTGTTLSGSLKFINPELPPYSRVKVCASLQLGILAEPDNEQLAKSVQLREFDIQLADPYRQNEQADFLLITNGNTQLEEMTNWLSLADNLGLQFSVWNSSLYNGISFVEYNFPPETGHPLDIPASTISGQPCCSRNGQHSLIEHFRHKTAVFLNYPDPDGKTPISTLPSMELSTCIADPNNNLKCYIIGPGASYRHPLQIFGIEGLEVDMFYPRPEHLQTQGARTRQVVDRYFLFPNAGKERLEKAAEKFARKLSGRRPETSAYVVIDHKNEKLPNRHLGRKQRLVGTMKVCLAPNDRNLIHRRMPLGTEHQVDSVFSEANVLGLLKSLPMTRKIDLVNNLLSSYTSFHKEMLQRAILAELVDEHRLFSESGSELSENAMKQRLDLLQEVVGSEYENEQAKLFIRDLLVEFRAFASRMATKKNMITKRQQRRLTSATKTVIDNFFRRHGFDKNTWRASYRARKMDFKKSSKAFMWKSYLPSTISRPLRPDPKCRNGVLDMAKLEQVHNNPRPSSVIAQGHIYHSPQERYQALEQLETEQLPAP